MSHIRISAAAARSPLRCRRYAGRLLRLWIPALLLASGVAAQSTAVAPATPSESAATASPVQTIVPTSSHYVVGNGDVLSVMVYNMPELNRIVVVGPRGNILLTYLPKAIPVNGLNPVQIGVLVRRGIQQQQILLDPQVEVDVKQVNSRPITVAGAVNQPKILQATNSITLLEAILLAGGPTSTAGNNVMVIQPHLPILDVPLSRVLLGDDPRYNITLTGGDFVEIMSGGQVFIAGDVRRPGGYPILPGQRLTISKLMALAGGWKAGAQAGKAALVSYMPNGSTRTQVLNLNKIMNRKDPDISLQANDMLYVPKNGLVSAALFVGQGVSGAMFLAFGYMIYKL